MKQILSFFLALVLAVLLTTCGGEAETETASPPPPSPPAGEQRSPQPEPEPRSPRGQLRVSFLDVGQGDATLIQSRRATMLVDAGRHDRSDVVPALRGRGVEEIDVIAITHGHADHIGQLPEVLEAFPVGEVWMSGTEHDTLTFERALVAIEDSGVGYEEPRAGDRTRIGGLEVEVVHPSRLTGDLHADSLSMRMSFGEVSFLFTGDAEAPHEAEMVGRGAGRLAAEVYQVGHHGSRTSTSAGFLSAASPEVAIYSAAEGNQYGHPHEEVIARLRRAGVDIYGTDANGAVTVISDGVDYRVRTERDGSPSPGAARAPPEPSLGPAAPSGDPGGGCVDLNTVSAQELERIIHIGPERAGQIIGLRPFSGVDDLARVSGIAESRLADIKAQGIVC